MLVVLKDIFSQLNSSSTKFWWYKLQTIEASSLCWIFNVFSLYIFNVSSTFILFFQFHKTIFVWGTKY